MLEVYGLIPYISKIKLYIIKYIFYFQFSLIHDMLSSDISSFSLLLMTENLGYLAQMVERSEKLFVINILFLFNLSLFMT